MVLGVGRLGGVRRLQIYSNRPWRWFRVSFLPAPLPPPFVSTVALLPHSHLYFYMCLLPVSECPICRQSDERLEDGDDVRVEHQTSANEQVLAFILDEFETFGVAKSFGVLSMPFPLPNPPPLCVRPTTLRLPPRLSPRPPPPP